MQAYQKASLLQLLCIIKIYLQQYKLLKYFKCYFNRYMLIYDSCTRACCLNKNIYFISYTDCIIYCIHTYVILLFVLFFFIKAKVSKNGIKVFEENIKMNKSRSNILEHAQEYAKSVVFVRQRIFWKGKYLLEITKIWKNCVLNSVLDICKNIINY